MAPSLFTSAASRHPGLELPRNRYDKMKMASETSPLPSPFESPRWKTLASQVSSINNADMTNILNASSTVVAPYDVSKLKVVVSAVTIDNAGAATIAWSDTLNGTKRTVGSTVTLPAALNVANSTLILGEVTYDYKPTIGYVITCTLTLSDKIYMRPRLTDTVTRVNS